MSTEMDITGEELPGYLKTLQQFQHAYLHWVLSIQVSRGVITEDQMSKIVARPM